MKINKRIRDLHESGLTRYGNLATEVRELLKPKVEERGWFFVGRLKGLESFALKIETGRVKDLAALEDFYACRIVVTTLNQVEAAEELVTEHFDLQQRRPPDDSRTHKRASEFVFDDLRLYVARRPQPSGRYPDLDGIVFEVQIMTVLQYAWSLATHDLIYKTDTVSWPKERIAYQVKAMLEHAEVAIAEAERLSASTALARQDSGTESIRGVINEAERFWSADALPEDRKRMAENLLGLLNAADVGVDQMEPILTAERRRLGMMPRDLDPYSFTIQALANSNQFNFEHKFKRDKVRTKIVIHDGMDVPEWMTQEHARIIKIESIDLPDER